LLTACKFSTPTTTHIVRIQQAFLEFQVRERKETSSTTKPSILLLLLPISYTPHTFPETGRIISDFIMMIQQLQNKATAANPKDPLLLKREPN